MSSWYSTTMRHIYSLGTQEWFAIMIVILVLGFFCMRGFGSRGEY